MANFREQRLFLMARSASRKSPRTRFITSKIQSLGDYGEFPRAKAIPNAFVRVSHTAPYLLYDISVYRRPTMANFRELGLSLTETVHSSVSLFRYHSQRYKMSLAKWVPSHFSPNAPIRAVPQSCYPCHSINMRKS
jgi:hypothetical protein